MGAEDRNHRFLSVSPTGGSWIDVALIAVPFPGSIERAPTIAGTAKNLYGFLGLVHPSCYLVGRGSFVVILLNRE